VNADFHFDPTLEKLVSIARKDVSLDAMWLYGSRAKGNASQISDYDFAVIFHDRLTDSLKQRVRPELLAVDWQRALGLPEGKVSVLDLEQAAIPLAMSVLTSGVLVFNNNPSHELEVTGRIMSKWEIDYQYHYKHYG